MTLALWGCIGGRRRGGGKRVKGVGVRAGGGYRVLAVKETRVGGDARAGG